MHSHEISASDGTRLHFTLIGPEAGPAMVLCHGLCAAGAQFGEDAGWFARRGFRVLVPDLRGHGQSGMPLAVTPEAFSPQRLRADIHAMLDYAGIGPVHWVGNSLGGILGLGTAAETPNRLASLTIFGTALALDLPPLGWIMPLLDRVPGRTLAARITARNTTDNRAALSLIETMLRQYDAQACAAIVRHIRRYDLTEEARAFRGPGLVLVGEKDRTVNRVLLRQLEMLRAAANWRIERLAQGGHCANLDATHAWRTAVLSFVQAPRAVSPGFGGAF